MDESLENEIARVVWLKNSRTYNQIDIDQIVQLHLSEERSLKEPIKLDEPQEYCLIYRN